MPDRDAAPQTSGVSPRDDQRLHRSLGTLSLTAITFSSVIGSGWLFAAYKASKLAGPAALISWVVAGLATLLIALVYIDLSFRRPLSGGNVRWPQLASGPLVGTVIGWAVFLQAAYAGPSEATAVAQYSGRWLPWLVSGEALTVPGRLCAAVLLIAVFALNMIGIGFVARVNNAVTAVKFIVPALTVVLLLASGFDTKNYAAGGGFAPNGFAASLTAIVGAGLIYSFTGINAAAVLSGEARDPRRTVPRATLTALAVSFVIYLGLQLSMLFTLPTGLLGTGWRGINLTSPLAQLASLIGMGWLSWLLLADAAFSPTGSILISASVKGRYTYGAAQNGILPRFFAAVHERTGIPRRALMLNLTIGVVIVLALGNWSDIASSLSFYYGLSYAAVSVAVTVLYAAGDRSGGWLGRWSLPVGASSFVLSGLILYWSGWERVRVAAPLLLIGLVVYAFQGIGRTSRTRLSYRTGAWLIVFLCGLGLVSFLGSFEGRDVIAAPYDSLLVGLASLVIWRAAYRSGLSWHRSAGVETGTTASEPAAPASGSPIPAEGPQT
ncbi:APC family permease [Actinoallomurus sp. CA-150999]|uniref:APC family permease n=1 Tax=Actinoallomurus sp. CA-150999 TaxID=3239887 RepID=UPI003D93B3E5